MPVPLPEPETQAIFSGGRLVCGAKVEGSCVRIDPGDEKSHLIDQGHLRPFSTREREFLPWSEVST